MRSGAMQCATGATSGIMFRQMYDDVGLPSQNPVASNSGVLYRLPKSPYNFLKECF
jgi:hypothetical protein